MYSATVGFNEFTATPIGRLSKTALMKASRSLSASSARLRSVMSWIVERIPVMRPSLSLTMTSSIRTATVDPSFLRRCGPLPCSEASCQSALL